MENIGDSMTVPQKIITRITVYDLAIPLLSICPKELKTRSQSDIFIPMFTEALFKIAKMWKQPKFHQWMTGQSKCGIYLQWNIQPLKGRKF